MTLKYLVLGMVLLGPTAFPAEVAGQLATIRPSPQNPLSPSPGSEAELEDFLRLQNTSDPASRLRFVRSFPVDSEFRHLVLFAEWQTRLELGHAPDEIIDVALRGIEAQEHFLARKLEFVSDPSRLEDLPAFRYTLEDRKAAYYRSVVDAYNSEGDFDRVVEYGELTLDTMDNAWALFQPLAEEGSEQYEQARNQDQDGRLFVLHTLMAGYQNAGEVEKIVETGEAILQASSPRDLQTLMTTSLLMSQQPPEDEAALQPYLQRAEEYAAEAVEQMVVLLNGPGGSDFTDLEKSELLADVNETLGAINYQLEDWAGAGDAYRASVEAVPSGTNYYMLGLSSYNDRNIEDTLSAFARAVYLEFPDTQARSSLEVLFEAINGSLDGLEDFIQSEGEQIPN